MKAMMRILPPRFVPVGFESSGARERRLAFISGHATQESTNDRIGSGADAEQSRDVLSGPWSPSSPLLGAREPLRTVDCAPAAPIPRFHAQPQDSTVAATLGSTYRMQDGSCPDTDPDHFITRQQEYIT
jgi:hypothetical protein